MKFFPSFVAFAILAVFVDASSLHDNDRRGLNHNKFIRRSNTTSRCKQRPPSYSSVALPTPSLSPQEVNSPSSYSSGPSTTYTSHASKPSPNKPNANNGSGSSSSNTGLINVPSNCGPIGATKAITPSSGPNGNIDWLNCGINGKGWNPPYVTVQDLISVDLSTALQHSGSPFHACSNFLWAFNQYGNQYGLPPILLASIAMQESSCNPNTVGGAGEQGLMQLTKDKCGQAPGGNCKDVNYNVMTGAKYFADTLASNNGNVLVTIGQYNGWKLGMTQAEATAMRWTGCCRCQNNLDYLQQVFNGWIQNKDAYTLKLGVYFNLDVC